MSGRAGTRGTSGATAARPERTQRPGQRLLLLSVRRIVGGGGGGRLVHAAFAFLDLFHRRVRAGVFCRRLLARARREADGLKPRMDTPPPLAFKNALDNGLKFRFRIASVKSRFNRFRRGEIIRTEDTSESRGNARTMLSICEQPRSAFCFCAFCFWLSAREETTIHQRFKMNLREISGAIEKELTSLFEELRSGITAREDSRAFGAMIERRILDNWAGHLSAVRVHTS